MMKDQGVLEDPRTTVLHENVMPWMYNRVLDFINDEDFIVRNVNNVVQDCMASATKDHAKRVVQEHNRIESDRLE
jgi:hypothetical protein